MIYKTQVYHDSEGILGKSHNYRPVLWALSRAKVYTGSSVDMNGLFSTFSSSFGLVKKQKLFFHQDLAIGAVTGVIG
jgi:hypothetical protein